MDNSSETETIYKAHFVWDKGVRWFHWINVICVISLAVFGTIILNAKVLSIGGEGKILLKELHVYVGYVFCLNLLWRLIWAFIGSHYSRWRAILPIGKPYMKTLKEYIKGSDSGNKKFTFLGHNPLGRLMVCTLLLLLLIQAITGLVLAGTDLYKPPIGSFIAQWVTQGDTEKLKNLKPGSKEYVDEAAYSSMREFRKPIVTTHLYCFYVLMVMIVLHVFAVIVSEIKERNNLISAMFSGYKILDKNPTDKH